MCQMNYESGKTRMTKSLDGFYIRVESTWQKEERADAWGWFTNFVVLFSSTLQLDLRIKSEGVFSGIEKNLGIEDVNVGHEKFDEAFLVRGNDPSRVRRVFSNRTCDLLFEILSVASCAVADEGINVRMKGLMVDELLLQRMIKLTCEVAEAMLAHRNPDRIDLPYR